MKNTLRNQSGFSLVELMVVVAIIGILATVAIPNFTKFQAKSRQTNAKSELTGIFTAEKSFFTEYNGYHARMSLVGFLPEGIVESTSIPNAGVIRYYATGITTANTADVWAGVLTTGTTDVGVYPCSPAAHSACAGTANSSPSGGWVGAIAAVAGGVPASAFTAAAHGYIRGPGGGVGMTDIWSMNQDRVLTNNASGL